MRWLRRTELSGTKPHIEQQDSDTPDIFDYIEKQIADDKCKPLKKKVKRMYGRMYD